MARRSFQKGCLQFHNGQWTLLYWLKDHARNKLTQRRECEAFREFTNKDGDWKAANERAQAFMVRVNELNNNPQQPTLPPSDEQALTFARFINTRWASFLRKKKLEPSTITFYDSLTGHHLIPAFGSRPMALLTVGDMTDFFDSLYKEGYEPKTILSIYNLLSMMFDVALDYDCIQAKPLRKSLHRPVYERKEKPTLSPEMVQRIIANLPMRDRMLVAVLATFTLRLGEALALRWCNVDFQARMLTPTHTLYKGKLKAKFKTKASKRKFEVPERFVFALEQYRLQSVYNGPEDYLFPNAIGGPCNPGNLRRRVLYPVMDNLGIERGKRTHGFHILRHTGATVLHAETGDIEVAQKALGHASRSTTETVYDHAEMVVDEGTVSKLMDALLGDSLIQHSNAIN